MRQVPDFSVSSMLNLEKGVLNLLTRRIRSLFQSWLSKRIPRSSSKRLSHRTLFILPTFTGVLFAGLLMVILVTAINYQSSLNFAVCFWLFSIGVVGMWVTYRNLSGLVLVAAHTQSKFVGETFSIRFNMITGPLFRHSISFEFPGQTPIEVSCKANEEKNIALPLLAKSRGILEVPRFKISSRFPFGIFKVWSWVALDVKALAYPKPSDAPLVFDSGHDGDIANHVVVHEAKEKSGDNDFYGLRSYQAGDSLKSIAWKQWAQERGLTTKVFDAEEGASCWLTWDMAKSSSVEERLSKLCGWLLQAHNQGLRYGLSLPGYDITPAFSEQHLEQCLEALALYGSRDQYYKNQRETTS